MHPIKDPRLWALGGVGLLIYLQTEHGLFGGGSFYGKAEHEEDEDISSCSWCSDDIVSEKDERYIRGELICDGCESAWHEQPDDGGFGAEGEDMWRAPTFREEVNEIAWGNMTDREPFEDEETLEKLHEYAIKSFGFEELRVTLQKEGNISPAVQDILEEEAYEAESHALMADMTGIMPPSALWNEEDDEADLDSSNYFAETIIGDDFHAEYMADSKSGGSSSRFMKPSEVIDLFKKANGTLVSVTFVKRTNGEVRKMLARTSVKKGVKGVGLKFSPKNKNLMGVYDFQKVREGADPWKCYRFVPVDAVLSMRVRGKTYTA